MEPANFCNPKPSLTDAHRRAYASRAHSVPTRHSLRAEQKWRAELAAFERAEDDERARLVAEHLETGVAEPQYNKHHYQILFMPKLARLPDLVYRLPQDRECPRRGTIPSRWNLRFRASWPAA